LALAVVAREGEPGPPSTMRRRAAIRRAVAAEWVKAPRAMPKAP
jgi:hypothetical protein